MVAPSLNCPAVKASVAAKSKPMAVLDVPETSCAVAAFCLVPMICVVVVWSFGRRHGHRDGRRRDGRRRGRGRRWWCATDARTPDKGTAQVVHDDGAVDHAGDRDIGAELNGHAGPGSAVRIG